MAPDNVAPGDRLTGEPDANDANVVEILAFQSGLTMPLTGLGRLAEGTGVVPPVLSATHVWITRGQSHDILEGRGASFLMCAVRASHALRKRKFMLREIAGVASHGGPPRSEGNFRAGTLGNLREMQRTGSAACRVDAAQIGALRIVCRGMIGTEKSRGSHAISLVSQNLGPHSPQVFM